IRGRGSHRSHAQDTESESNTSRKHWKTLHSQHTADIPVPPMKDHVWIHLTRSHPLFEAFCDLSRQKVGACCTFATGARCRKPNKISGLAAHTRFGSFRARLALKPRTAKGN